MAQIRKKTYSKQKNSTFEFFLIFFLLMETKLVFNFHAIIEKKIKFKLFHLNLSFCIKTLELVSTNI